MTIQQVVKNQHEYFDSQATKSLAFRVNALKKLQYIIKKREGEIQHALLQDLGKAKFESNMSELYLVLDELKYTIKHLSKWMDPTFVKTPIMHFPSKSFILKEPYGVVLIMAPWNYPFMLNMIPLIGAIAAGNCVVMKPSEYAPATSKLIKEMLEIIYVPQYVAVVEGGRAQNTDLLRQQFNYIFFTGSVAVGKVVMQAASQNLTPVTLELGGKSPCIVDDTANIKLAARRIVFGKYLNAGQTCVAPDYVLVQENIKQELMDAIQEETKRAFGEKPIKNKELPKIITQKHFERLRNLLQGENIVMGGNDDGMSRIAPTMVDSVTEQSPLMQEEIFGPILPILTFEKIQDAIDFVKKREKPLALYLFTTNAHNEKRVLLQCSFGGGCVNDTVVHIANSRLPFGGVGYSGMGHYHGKQSFDTFTHEKSMLKKSNKIDLPVRYHPYTSYKEKIIELLMK